MKKKTDKDNYHIPNTYKPILLSNIMGKTFEETILQEAVNLLTESNFLMEKMSMCIKKMRMHTSSPAFFNWADVRGNCKW